MEDVENRLYLKNLLTCLDGRTKRVLWLRATGYTFKEIGGLLDISS
jgi:DNA-binding CsgD family transcriptional regulator